jgi:hypothetical protein
MFEIIIFVYLAYRVAFSGLKLWVETSVSGFGMIFSQCPLSYALACIMSGDLRW